MANDSRQTTDAAREVWEGRVRGLFDDIAHVYDRMNDMLSFRVHQRWRRFAMARMGVRPGESALDVCCGTCDWTIALARASGTGRTVGLDFSSRMLEVGREKLRRAGLERRVELVLGNAMELPFPDDTFDYATIGFGLRNVPDIMRVLGEMRRVVRPGGKVVCLELSKSVRMPLRPFYFFYFRRVLPLLGKWLAGRFDSYKWLPESVASFPGIDELADMFRAAGLEDVQAFPLTFGIAALHVGIKPPG
ncbi:MAG: bifunctional demethylmenaquinone methyltransferase/2-methoxy-6-polyprenyl-1,4-benzoquinol methylase [Candidatus Reconcilbacillus cellulovorans]|uniref:Demethylmenaquinone methyltransferase n=1 Tax=Candidatus Reconcilbacillus cellulovorans TaxID=1906605 RepID=A0A2A6E3I6_9BACL|nr:MAG: bifunctional demethylmenaquinone methyltransferase/2-methoxy-6-polyprenyl-1,4-benzoquinol methylase [Candidatus Reconcilbacillus cellulovorans]